MIMRGAMCDVRDARHDAECEVRDAHDVLGVKCYM
jgi:hypothetical protein